MALITSAVGWGARRVVKTVKKAVRGKKNSHPSFQNYVAAQRFTGPPVPEGYRPPQQHTGPVETVEVDVDGYELPRRRRRRKQLLTASDRQDIAFIVGTLGKGEMGKAAISQLLARTCN